MLAKQTGNDILWFQYESDGNRVGFTYNDTAYYYTKNAQGDVIGIVDGNCNTVVEYSYDAWGKLLSTTGSMADSIGQKNPFLYRGYYYDFETGMYYLNSRYYDPNTGRFLNADGQFNPDTGLAGNNLFTYCNNNPINASDYNGARFTESDDASGRWVNYVNNRMYSGTGRPITGGANISTKNNSVVQSLNNRKPGKTPHVGWPKLPPNLGGKKPKWNSEGYWDGAHGGRYTWDTHSHGAGVDRGNGPQDGHWDDENSDNRWDRNGVPLFQNQSFSFTDQISNATGLTGVALAVYIVVSEGSRIIPARNLIPVP